MCENGKVRSARCTILLCIELGKEQSPPYTHLGLLPVRTPWCLTDSGGVKVPVEGVGIWFGELQEQGYLGFGIPEEPTCGPGTKYTHTPAGG